MFVEPASLVETKMFLWRFRNKISDAEYQFEAMLNKRKPSQLPSCQYLPPLIVDNPQADEEDEEFAEEIMQDLRAMLCEFMNTHSGVKMNPVC